ncbi:MAG: hypothetical protein Q8K56_00200, partial [Rhodoglobus sp.]|nr:hypothetical protein [Rhodoglobus sp.]
HLEATATPAADGTVAIDIHGSVTAEAGIVSVAVSVDGVAVPVELSGDAFSARTTVPADRHRYVHSEWREPYGSIAIATAEDAAGRQAGEFVVVGGVG